MLKYEKLLFEWVLPTFYTHKRSVNRIPSETIESFRTKFRQGQISESEIQRMVADAILLSQRDKLTESFSISETQNSIQKEIDYGNKLVQKDEEWLEQNKIVLPDVLDDPTQTFIYRLISNIVVNSIVLLLLFIPIDFLRRMGKITLTSEKVIIAVVTAISVSLIILKELFYIPEQTMYRSNSNQVNVSAVRPPVCGEEVLRSFKQNVTDIPVLTTVSEKKTLPSLCVDQ